MKLLTLVAIALGSIAGDIAFLATHARADGSTNAHHEVGRASWYHEGQRVACGGARFNPDGLTAASRSLPCGARARVTNRGNGRSVELTINDYGPAKWTGRVIDVSRGSARVLGMIEAGVVDVTVERLR